MDEILIWRYNLSEDELREEQDRIISAIFKLQMDAKPFRTTSTFQALLENREGIKVSTDNLETILNHIGTQDGAFSWLINMPNE